jgi:sugar fermentation stimulation protein A
MQGLAWPRLIEGLLVRRYKRFKADVTLRNGHVITALCPNSGSMMGCCEPGRRVYLSRSTNQTRRLKYTWEMIQMPSSLVGINTLVPNRLVKQAIQQGQIPAFAGYEKVFSEVRYGRNSRIDLLVEDAEKGRCFIEIKNCTLVEDGIAYFPDAVTTRGLKHLVELQDQVRLGNRSVNLFLVQRMDATRFRPADHIDPAYGRELRQAVRNGVEIQVYDVRLDLDRIALNGPLPWQL